MKLTISLLFLVFSLALISKCEARYKTRALILNRKPYTQNVFYKFLVGTISQIGGRRDFIEKCSKLVKGWIQVGKKEEENDESNSIESLSNNLIRLEPIWKKSIKHLNSAINLVCSIKDKIIAYLINQNRFYRRRRFTQGNKSRKWSFEDFGSYAKNFIKSAGEAIVAGSKRVKSGVVDGVDWTNKKAPEVASFIRVKVSEIFQPLLDLFDDFRAKFANWLVKHPMTRKVFKFIKCIIKHKEIYDKQSFKDNVENSLELLPGVTTPIGWVRLVVNLICGWENVKMAVNFLIKARATKERLLKYLLYGKFLGRIIAAIASK